MQTQKAQSSIVYPKVKFTDVFSAFWRSIRTQKWRLFLLIFSVVFANVVLIVVPILYKQFFDILVSGTDKDIIARKLIVIIISIAILHGIFWLLYRIANLANNTYQPKVMANLKQQSYDYLMRHSYSFFAGNFVGSLVQMVNRFARAFEDLSDNFIWNLLPLFVRVASIFTVVLFIDTWIAFIILLWIIVFLSFNVIFSKWKLKYDIKAAEIDSKSTGYLADTITNQNTIQLFSRLKHESEGYRKVTNEQAKITIFTWNLNNIIEGVQTFLGIVIELGLFFLAIIYWQKGLITVGVFVLIQAYLITLIDQLWGFTKIVRNIYRSYADAKEMTEILLLPHEVKDAPKAQELVVKEGNIDFEKLSFSFQETRQVLKNIHLKISPGEKVALVGPSGAGKTTLVRLLLRFYSPTSGKILIDGQDISRATQESLRRKIAMVPQDPILFHRTLAENIRYGKPDASIGEIERAAEIAHADEFIRKLPLGFETFVGERGIKLSGGERQRIAIARAILKNAPILVLDEATSSLDSHSELLIKDALDKLMAGKTTIVIAHRLSTIQKMDRIIVIDAGKIIEDDSHKALLKKKHSLYKKLWMLQAGGFLVNEDEEEEQKVLEEITENGSDEAEEE